MTINHQIPVTGPKSTSRDSFGTLGKAKRFSTRSAPALTTPKILTKRLNTPRTPTIAIGAMPKAKFLAVGVLVPIGLDATSAAESER
jgi:hypothetical protein